MRNLFLLLLLGNLVLLGWQTWSLPPAVPLPPASTGELALLGVAGQDPPPTGPQRCFQVGPFAEPAALQAALRTLRLTGREVAEVRREGEVWLGNWVQLEGFASLEAAETARRRLVAGGLSDAYIMQADELHRISLGVFRERERAEAVARRARELGFRPQVGDRTRPALERWLEIRLASGDAFDLGSMALPAAQIIRAEEVPCTPSPDAGDAFQTPE